MTNDVQPPPAEEATPRRSRLAWVRRLVRITGLLALACFAGGLVALFLVDLGPRLRPLAEREGTRLINRPLHIGRISTNLLRGRFVFDDLVIENTPDSSSQEPFFRAKRIVVVLPWWTIPLRREILIESVVLSDWQMRVETYPGGRHNFIKIPTRQPSTTPRRFVTTIQLVRAEGGEFVYQDYGAPWSTVARNLDITIARLRTYRGEARFSGGTVQIQRFEPMRADMFCTFRIDGSQLSVERVDLDTDGARSHATGVINLARWPEQTYNVTSRVQFPRMRELFFARDQFTLGGEGDFEGTFKLFKGGRDLSGRFYSAEARLNDWRFPELRGSLQWLPERFDVTGTHSDFMGGGLDLTYSMAPLGASTPAIARLDTTFDAVDLATLTDFLERPVLRLDGRLAGRHVLEWPLGRFRDRHGDGELRAAPPPGIGLMSREKLQTSVTEPPEMGPFNPYPIQGYVPVGGTVRYTYSPDWLDVEAGEVATAKTYVSFRGRTAFGDRSEFPFFVASADWQESDRFLAAIMNAVGTSTRAIPIGGRGEFEGLMTGAFRAPRIVGRFLGDDMRAWDVNWGRISGAVTIFNSYAEVRDGRVSAGDAEMDVDGRFSIGFPRRDGSEELDARIQIRRWPVTDLRHAFALDDYPVTGALSGDFHIYDRYLGPQGFGRMSMSNITAYGEFFEQARAALTFEGGQVRLDAIEATKGAGEVTGAALVRWEGTYSFDVGGRQIALDQVAALSYPQVPMTGLVSFSATGSGSFESPRYEVRGRIDDLHIQKEPVGQVTGRLVIRDDVLTVDQLEAASPRLSLSGSGRVALTPQADGELVFRFQEAALDPYVRALRPQLAAFTGLTASGSLRVFGELRTPALLRAEAVLEDVQLNLFDYNVHNDGDVRFSLSDEVVQVDRLRLIGQGTALDVAGNIQLAEQRITLRALGDANLGIFQGLMPDIRSSGDAELRAEIRGSLEAPTVLGALLISNGRLRHFAFPHSLESINGRVEFDAAGLSTDLNARLGGGEVRISGRLGFKGLQPTEYNLAATGRALRLRYPEGFRSVVDADLSLRGDFFSPLLLGTVNVQNATLERTFDTGGTGLFGFAAVGVGGRVAQVVPSRIPVRFDVRLNAPATLRVENRAARLVSSAELNLRGTYDQPLLFGRVDIDSGEVFFEGNRYQVTRGTVDFINPTRIEPLFDIEAETRARVTSQVYRVITRVSGTPDRFAFNLSSDPPLATVDILSLLFGDVRDPQDAELRALRAPEQAEQELLRARAARLLASPISSGVGRVVEQAIGVDSVQITPLLSDLSAQESSRLTPSARLTVGKRISNRFFLTYSRALNASTRDEIILLEFTQSDRFSWVVSQNEDRTYAVDVRVRRAF